MSNRVITLPDLTIRDGATQLSQTWSMVDAERAVLTLNNTHDQPLAFLLQFSADGLAPWRDLVWTSAPAQQVNSWHSGLSNGQGSALSVTTGLLRLAVYATGTVPLTGTLSSLLVVRYSPSRDVLRRP